MEATYSELKARWLDGEREHELALQLMYFAWMHWADPPFVTGLQDDENAIALWFEIFEFFGAEAASDAEFLYVTAIMAIITPEELGGETLWAPRIARLQTKSKETTARGLRARGFRGTWRLRRLFRTSITADAQCLKRSCPLFAGRNAHSFAARAPP